MPQPTISTCCPTEHELTFLPEQEQADPDFFFQDFGDNRIAQFLATHKAPHRHKYHEIAWFRHGKSRHLLDGELEEVPSHTIVLVSKGRVHSYQHLKKPEGNVIRFNDDFLTATSSILFSQFLGLSHIRIPEKDIVSIESMFALIKSESEDPSRYNAKTIRFILQALISKIEELKVHSLGDRHPSFGGKQKLWEQFCSLVEECFWKKHSVVYYAQELGVAPRKLNETVKLLVGKTASEVIDERRILEAKRLIRFSGLTMKEIAFELGYEEHSYFTKVFKKITGFTPTQFK